MSKIMKNLSFILVLLGILSLATGVTFSLFTSNKESEEVQLIKSGIVQLTLQEDGSFNITDANQMTDEEGFLQENYHDFTITNTGDADASYEIFLLDDPDSIVDYEGKVLDASYIRVGLEVDGERKQVVNLKDVNRLIYTGTLAKKNKSDFRLRLWLDFTNLTDDEISSLEGYNIFLKMKVEASQVFTDAI